MPPAELLAHLEQLLHSMLLAVFEICYCAAHQPHWCHSLCSPCCLLSLQGQTLQSFLGLSALPPLTLSFLAPGQAPTPAIISVPGIGPVPGPLVPVAPGPAPPTVPTPTVPTPATPTPTTPTPAVSALLMLQQNASELAKQLHQHQLKLRALSKMLVAAAGYMPCAHICSASASEVLHHHIHPFHLWC